MGNAASIRLTTILPCTQAASGRTTTMTPTLYYGLATVLVLVGLAGTVLPVIPGTALIFGGLLLAAWADGFTHVGWVGLTIIGALAVLAFVADFVASLLGAK